MQGNIPVNITKNINFRELCVLNHNTIQCKIFVFYHTIKLLHFSKAYYKTRTLQNHKSSTLVGSNSAVKTHYTSVKFKHKRQLFNNTGTNHKVKTVQTFNFASFSSLQGWAIHRTPSTQFQSISCTMF